MDTKTSTQPCVARLPEGRSCRRGAISQGPGHADTACAECDTRVLRRNGPLGRFAAWIDGRPLTALVLLALFALALDVSALYFIPPTFNHGQTQHWWPIALSVAHGRGYVACYPEYFPFCGPANQVTAQREPVPVLLFAAVSLLTNDSLAAGAAAEILVNLAILCGVFFLARELADARTGLLAALAWSLYLPAIQLVPQVSGELPATLALTWGLYFFVRAGRTRCTGDWLLAGAWLGVGALSRSALMIVAPALALGLLLRLRHTGPAAQPSLASWTRPIALLLLAWALVATPWAARNSLVFGQPVFGSTLAGYNLYRENYILTTDNYLRFVASDEGLRAIQALITRRSDLHGTENEAQMEAIYRGEAVRIITSHPFRYAALSAYRFLMLWFNWGVVEAYGSQGARFSGLIMAQQLLLLLAAGAGLSMMWRRGWPLGVTLVAVSLLCMAVISRQRFIVPVMPLTVALAALACSRAVPALLIALQSLKAHLPGCRGG